MEIYAQHLNSRESERLVSEPRALAAAALHALQGDRLADAEKILARLWNTPQRSPTDEVALKILEFAYFSHPRVNRPELASQKVRQVMRLIGPPETDSTVESSVPQQVRPTEFNPRTARRFLTGEPEISLLIDGNPQYGTVLLLRQLHRRDDSPPEELRQVGALQWAIANELLRRRVPGVFTEGFRTEDQPRYLKLRELLARTVLPTGLPEVFLRLSPLQRELVATLGGPLLAGGLSTKINVFPLTSEAEDAFIGEAKLPTALDSYREQRAAAAVLNLLEQRPGSTVALVFGADHTFASPVWRAVAGEKKPLPRVYSFSWDVFASQFPALSAYAFSWQHSATKQAYLLEQTAELPPAVLSHLVSDELKLRALKKIAPARAGESSADYARSLAALAYPKGTAPAEFTAKLDDLAQKERGPFRKR